MKLHWLDKRNVLIFVAFIFLIFTGYLYKQATYSFHFVDEEYNLAVGKYLLNGELLYDDIISNQQPFPPILSAVVQKFSKPNTTFLLIGRHRETIVLWSIIWSIILVFYFGLPALAFVIVYEFTKFYLFGNLFLAESIVVYPLLFLVGLALLKKPQLTRPESMLIGFCLAVTIFSLGPIWPLLGFLTLFLIYNYKKRLKNIPYLFLGSALPVFLLIKYTSIPGYFYWYINSNLAYTIPRYHTLYYNNPWLILVTKAFITPVLAFTPLNPTPTLWVTRVISLILLFNLMLLFKRKEFKEALASILILGLSNLRFYPPGNQYYDGFHLLPWYSSLIFITALISWGNFKQIHAHWFRLPIVSLWVVAILISLKHINPILNRAVQKDYYISYSRPTQIGEVISIMKNDNDTLFLSTNDWLVYWQSNTNHLPKLYGDYAWMLGIPKLEDSLIKTFSTKPPTFLFCKNCSYGSFKNFLFNYKRVKINRELTDLYVLSSKTDQLTHSQLERLKFYDLNFGTF